MKKYIYVIICLIVVFTAGCQSNYVETQETQLQNEKFILGDSLYNKTLYKYSEELVRKEDSTYKEIDELNLLSRDDLISVLRVPHKSVFLLFEEDELNDNDSEFTDEEYYINEKVERELLSSYEIEEYSQFSSYKIKKIKLEYVINGLESGNGMFEYHLWMVSQKGDNPNYLKEAYLFLINEGLVSEGDEIIDGSINDLKDILNSYSYITDYNLILKEDYKK